jgi:acyl carrier protein
MTCGARPEADGQIDIRSRVRRFIVSNFYVTEGSLDDDESLLEQGIVDSTGVLEVIAFIEGEFGVQVADDEMVPQNLDSIARVAAYIARKQAQARRYG